MWIPFLVVAFFLGKGNTKECAPYFVGNDLVACICNSTYCDDTPNDNQPKLPESGTFYWYVTNKEGLRMKMSTAKFSGRDSHDSSSNVTLVINRKKTYQRIIGFGGAFTDATGINLRNLSTATQDQLIRAYYDPKVGSGYNIARIPIGATDASTGPYSYDDIVGDTSLKHFALTQEDHDYKIPYLTKALKLNPTIKFFGSAWSAPGWMKTSEKYDRFGYLKDQYYQVYANYLAKFAEEYQKHGLDMWAITTDNEPSLHYRVNATIMCTMGWIPEDLSRWVANNLGPALESSTSKGTRVLALDDNTDLLPGFINPLFKNQNASRYTIGTAIHWYADDKTSITVLDDTHDKFPDKIIIMTETSGGPPYWGTPNVASKIWNLGEKYMLSMIKVNDFPYRNNINCEKSF
ncbi:PREDICTED: glucosylceramidase-like [Dufourea novaeangliae]|uniref:glucosylceramidase-like n=1 Tax=Dufourea novaeangliae TaxID=178035 RepID=UPI0007677981|nr:PREDICTED: glucosylceramidase-like [Dufourea novaeangliae]